jgi:hypothetical protein
MPRIARPDPAATDECLAWREKEFQKHVLALAESYGWSLRYHSYFSDRSEKGFPDLYMIRVSTGQAIAAEMKTMRGRLSAQQEAWLEALRAHEQAVRAASDVAAAPLFAAYLWRPCCWLSGEIDAALRMPRSRRATSTARTRARRPADPAS